MGTGKLLGKPNKLRGNNIPSRGSRNTPSRFMIQKPGITSGSYEPVGFKASFISGWTLQCTCSRTHSPGGLVDGYHRGVSPYD